MSLKSVFSTTQRLLAATAIAACALAGAANAAVIVQYSPAGLPSPGGTVNTLDFSGHVGATSSFTLNSGTVTVSFNGGTIVQGSQTNAYAAPVTDSAGDTVTAPYISTGGTPNSVTLTFASAQSYLGLLWGSIGTGDLLTFKDSTGATIASITGAQAQAASPAFNGMNGSQNYGGSQYTLVNFTGSQFSSVVISQTGNPSFEAANFQYAAQNVTVPEPASVALLGAGLMAIGALRRRKTT